MTPPPAPSPHPSTGPSVAWLVADSVIGPTDGPADPSTFVQARVDLFMRDYDEHRGVVSSISGGDGAAPKRGVDSIPRPSPARAPSSPKRSRISSPRRVLAATAGAVVRAVSRPDDRSDGRASVDHPPSPPRRTRSPADVIAGAFAPPPQPSKRSSNGFAFLGLVPKSAFLNWMRSSIKNNYEGLASSHLKREINNRRSMILYHFSKVGKLSESAESDGRSGPTLRSDVSDDADDWVLDMDAATCAVTNVRRLDRYPIEMLLTLRRGTKLLLLVNVSDDAKLLLSKGAKVDELQRLPKRIADDILKTLSDVYKESMDKQTAVQPEEEMAPGEKNAPTESTKPRDVVRIKARSKKKENKKGKKSNMHPLIGKDVWTLGMTFETKNSIAEMHY